MLQMMGHEPMMVWKRSRQPRSFVRT
jgi:hypothetical protein